MDATLSAVCLLIALASFAISREFQSREPIPLLTPLLVAAVGTVGAFVMWRLLLEERGKAIAFQTSSAAATVQHALELELRQLVRQLHHTADEPDPTVFRETELQQPDIPVIWTDTNSLRADQLYLAEAIRRSDSQSYAVVDGKRAEASELVVAAPKKDGGLRLAAFRVRDFLDPILGRVLASNFNLSLVRNDQPIYLYPPSARVVPRTAEYVSQFASLHSELRLEPQLDFVRHGGTASVHLTLTMGLIASFLLAFSVYLQHASRARLAEVQEVRAGLELEIEERRHAEADLERHAKLLQASNTELLEFAHVVSHDLQEPLRSIRGFAQIMERRYHEHLDSEGHEFLQFITESSVRMNAMIQGLLAYSRLNHTDTHEEVFSLVEAVDWARRNLAMAIGECEAIIEIGDLPQVHGNRLQYCQLMQNLIGNALKYRGAEKPFVRISATPAGTEFIVTVADNGLGIGPEFQDRIFGLFKRAHGREYPGAGVGLALCKKIVERHGGQIWVESTICRGSQFHIRLPIV
jgi:signal transduction histidine kinase